MATRSWLSAILFFISLAASGSALGVERHDHEIPERVWRGYSAPEGINPVSLSCYLEGPDSGRLTIQLNPSEGYLWVEDHDDTFDLWMSEQYYYSIKYFKRKKPITNDSTREKFIFDVTHYLIHRFNGKLKTVRGYATQSQRERLSFTRVTGHYGHLSTYWSSWNCYKREDPVQRAPKF